MRAADDGASDLTARAGSVATHRRDTARPLLPSVLYHATLGALAAFAGFGVPFAALGWPWHIVARLCAPLALSAAALAPLVAVLSTRAARQLLRSPLGLTAAGAALAALWASAAYLAASQIGAGWMPLPLGLVASVAAQLGATVFPAFASASLGAARGERAAVCALVTVAAGALGISVMSLFLGAPLLTLLAPAAISAGAAIAQTALSRARERGRLERAR